ncbi:MAG TPA: amidase family protein, partial [Blastocatellia bacterium]|nr:amidase family protein [Blastocatellia bacterium]
MDHSRRDFLKKSAVFTLATAGGSLLPEYAAAQLKPKLSELANYDALGLVELIRKKQISPLELVDDVIGRVERVNPRINAVLTKLFDVEKARERAKNGVLEGPFAGVPVMLKNLTQYKDARIDAGSRLYARYIEKKGNPFRTNSPLIDAMERSGMIVAGIANAPELGLLDTTEPVLYGATRNPWNTDHTAGGSSGGSAAAVAAGIVPLAHGTDAGGSIRIPACHCGLFGLKPTRERELGNTHAWSLGMESLNIASELCLSRSVRDAAAFLNVVEKKNIENLPPVGFISGPSKKRLKVALTWETFLGKKPHPEVEKAVRESAQLLESLGHKVDETKMGFDGPEFMDTFLGIFAAFTMQYEARIELLIGGEIKREDALEPWTLGLIEMAKSRGGIQPCSQRAIKVFTEASAAVEKLFKTYDAILSPVMRVPPYKIGWHSPTLDFNTLLTRLLDELGYTPLHNAVGTPAMSAPLYWTSDGLPVGSH